MHTAPQTYILSYYLPFLYGPLIFLFSKHYLQKAQWHWGYFLHFVPFAVYLVFFSFGRPRANAPAIIESSLQSGARMVLQLASICIYHIMAWRILQNKSNTAEVNVVYKTKKQFLKKLLIISLCATAGIVAMMYFLYTRYPYYQNVRWAFSLLTVFIYWISYETLKKPELFKVIKGSNKPLDATYIIPPLKVHHPPLKYSNSGLKEEEALRILKLLQKLMHTDQLYLDTSLTIDALAEKLYCQKHHLSQVLNDKLKQSFAELLNEMRTEEAKRLLSDPLLGHYKISSVAYDAGFNSLSSFNDIFKKREGITPSRYRVISQQANQSQIKRV